MRRVAPCLLSLLLIGAADSKDVGRKAQYLSQLAHDLTVSLVAPDMPICVGDPIELVGTLENVGDRDLLLADPRKCLTCLFFDVEDSSGRTVSRVPPKGPVYQIVEPKPEMILLKPGRRVEFRRDISDEPAGRRPYQLTAGDYRILAMFINPGGFRTATGTKAINGIVESRPLEITIGECSH